MSNKIKNIFKSEYTFENEYIPSQIPHREKEISLLSENLLKLITDSNAISRKIIVCGKLHTARTTTILLLIRSLLGAARNRNVKLKTIYIDCEDNSNEYVLQEIQNQLTGSLKAAHTVFITTIIIYLFL